MGHESSDLFNLIFAKSYLTKLLAKQSVNSHIDRYEPEILIHPELVVNTVSMEKTVQLQQAETAEAAHGKADTEL